MPTRIRGDRFIIYNRHRSNISSLSIVTTFFSFQWSNAFLNNSFIVLQSKQHSAGFAGSAEGVPDNSGNLQMRSRVSAKTRTGLQLRPQGMFTAIFIQGSVTTVSCIPCLLNCRNYCATGIYVAIVSHFEHPRIVPRIFIFRKRLLPFHSIVRNNLKRALYSKIRNDKVKFAI